MSASFGQESNKIISLERRIDLQNGKVKVNTLVQELISGNCKLSTESSGNVNHSTFKEAICHILLNLNMNNMNY